VDIKGARSSLRVSEENASIKTLIKVENGDETALIAQLQEELEKLRIENQQIRNNDDDITRNEGLGLLLNRQNGITVKPGNMKSVNGIDTSGICQELLTGEEVSNKSLVFLNCCSWFSGLAQMHLQYVFVANR
jgi:hypothetical protein